MPKILVDLSEEEDKKVAIFKIKNDLVSKEAAIKEIIREFEGSQ